MSDTRYDASLLFLSLSTYIRSGRFCTVLLLLLLYHHNSIYVVFFYFLSSCNLYYIVYMYIVLQTRVRVGRRRNRDPCSRQHGRTSPSTRIPVRRFTPNGIVSTKLRVSQSKSANRCCTIASEYKNIMFTFIVHIKNNYDKIKYRSMFPSKNKKFYKPHSFI